MSWIKFQSFINLFSVSMSWSIRQRLIRLSDWFFIKNWNCLIKMSKTLFFLIIKYFHAASKILSIKITKYCLFSIDWEIMKSFTSKSIHSKNFEIDYCDRRKKCLMCFLFMHASHTCLCLIAWIKSMLDVMSINRFKSSMFKWSMRRCQNCNVSSLNFVAKIMINAVNRNC